MKYYLSHLTEDDKRRLMDCFVLTGVVNKYEILKNVINQVEHLLNDFVAKRSTYKIGKTKERQQELLDEIEFLKKYPLFTLPMNEEWIKYKTECLAGIRKVVGPSHENQMLIEWLKEQTFKIYDQYNWHYFESLNPEDQYKQRQICYFINKASFVSLVNSKIINKFYGYKDVCKPKTWKIEKWEAFVLEDYKYTSTYKDSRKHTLLKRTNLKKTTNRNFLLSS